VATYPELQSDDPAWPGLEAAIRASGRATVLPREPGSARACLERLQVSTRSTLGAIAHETGGILVDRGWLRLLGSGSARLPRALATWNDELAIPLTHFLLVGDDVVGGSFSINSGGLGRTRHVFYFAPDSLAWEDTGLGHSEFVHWALTGDLETFYATMRWPGWPTEVEPLAGDQAISLQPPPWTVEGRDKSAVSRRRVPARELWLMQQEIRAQLDAAGH